MIVGAGSSGCALASRLSERSSRTVLLVDAGPDYLAMGDFPPELARVDSFGALLPGNAHNWAFVGDLMPDHPYPMPRGKVVGGSSALNGTVFIRAREVDFDRWAALGNPAWGYGEVLPYFLKSETDLDFVGDENHGGSGPMPVRRARRDALHPVSEAFVEACLKAGFPEERDKKAWKQR